MKGYLLSDKVFLSQETAARLCNVTIETAGISVNADHGKIIIDYGKKIGIKIVEAHEFFPEEIWGKEII